MNIYDLNWAAGFFDGEGHTGVSDWRNGIPAGIRMQINQNDPEVLYRFQKIVGVGRVFGPYNHGNKNPYWSWKTASFESVQTVFAMLYPFMSSLKRDQGVAVLKLWKSTPRQSRVVEGIPCKYGHPYERNKFKQCIPCRREADKRRR